MSCLANATQRLVRATNVPTTDLTVCAWCICSGALFGDVAYSLDSTTTFQGQFFVNLPNNNNHWWFFADDVGNVDLGIVSTVWTFLCFTRHDNTSNGTQIYTGTGGALTKTSPTYTGTAIAGSQITVYNEADAANPFRGNILGFKMWDTVLTDDEVASEYLRIRPMTQMANLNTFFPTLNNTDAILDWSGNGRNATQTGTFADSRLMPPIPWQGLPK